MYIELKKGEGILSKENLFYKGDTSTIYKYQNELYKIYQKHERHQRAKLDILITNINLRQIGILPNCKLKTTDGFYGMRMRYLPHTETFLSYLKKPQSLPKLIEIMITLSDNLKLIHASDIHFSDLHHNNILIDEHHKPWYIDFDDAVIGEYSSEHICMMCRNMHEIASMGKKGFFYEEDLIKYGNLDCESLFIMFLNHLLDNRFEKLSPANYFKLVDDLSNIFPTSFINALTDLKKINPADLTFPHYIGDYLKQEEIQNNCYTLKLRRKNNNEHNSF